MKILVIAVEERPQENEEQIARVRELEERIAECKQLIHDMNQMQIRIRKIGNPAAELAVQELRRARLIVIARLQESRKELKELCEIRWNQAGATPAQPEK